MLKQDMFGTQKNREVPLFKKHIDRISGSKGNKHFRTIDIYGCEQLFFEG